MARQSVQLTASGTPGSVVASGHRPALRLPRGATWSALPGRAGIRLSSESGLVWVTVAGDAADYVLRGGEWLCLPAGRKAVAQALADSVMRVLPDRATGNKMTD